MNSECSSISDNPTLSEIAAAKGGYGGGNVFRITEKSPVTGCSREERLFFVSKNAGCWGFIRIHLGGQTSTADGRTVMHHPRRFGETHTTVRCRVKAS